jgi:hypothetical protein
MFKSTILLVPGLGNSDEQHWQSYWEQSYHFTRVNLLEWQTPTCEDWMQALDKAVVPYTPSDVLLVCHSLACATMAAWAEKYGRTIKAALLVAPADTEQTDFPAKAIGFSPMPLQKLAFPSIVVASTNDEYVSLARARYFAQCWGSQFVNVGALGHINSATHLKDWPQGLQLLLALDQHR